MLGMHVLHLTEGQFWCMTPRKFCALIDAYAKYKTAGSDSEQTAGTQQQRVAPPIEETTIDQAPSWW